MKRSDVPTITWASGVPGAGGGKRHTKGLEHAVRTHWSESRRLYGLRGLAGCVGCAPGGSAALFIELVEPSLLNQVEPKS